VEHSARDASSPGLAEVIDSVINATWRSTASSPYRDEIRRTVNQVVVYRLMALAADDQASPQARAIASLKLDVLKRDLTQGANTDADRAQAFYTAGQIERFQRDPKTVTVPRPAAIPPGMPIGDLD
jgi:hypothetical protein